MSDTTEKDSLSYLQIRITQEAPLCVLNSSDWAFLLSPHTPNSYLIYLT